MDPDDEDECLQKSVGHEITWKPGKNMTVKVVEKKQKKKGKVRTVKEEVPADSFFNFFEPPDVPDEDEEMDEDEMDQLHEQLETDYDIGCTIKDKIVPRAVAWFTGEAVLDDDDEDYDDEEDDEDEDDDEEEDDDDDDDDDDDESEEESEEDHIVASKPKKGGKGSEAPPGQGENPECKNQ